MRASAYEVFNNQIMAENSLQGALPSLDVTIEKTDGGPGHDSAKRRPADSGTAIVQRDPGVRRLVSLQFRQLSQGARDGRMRASTVQPYRKESSSEILAHKAAPLLDDLLAAIEPA